MDAHLKRLRYPPAALLCAFALGCTTATAAMAADINDPTLPPAPVRAEAATRAEPVTAEPAGPRMIVRGPGDVRSALLDGRLVKVGDSVSLEGSAARVIRITESALVVRRADHRTATIELFPGTALAVRCTHAVGASAVPCSADATSGLEKKR